MFALSPLLEATQTLLGRAVMSAFDPKRTWESAMFVSGTSHGAGAMALSPMGSDHEQRQE